MSKYSCVIACYKAVWKAECFLFFLSVWTKQWTRRLFSRPMITGTHKVIVFSTKCPLLVCFLSFILSCPTLVIVRPPLCVRDLSLELLKMLSLLVDWNPKCPLLVCFLSFILSCPTLVIVRPSLCVRDFIFGTFEDAVFSCVFKWRFLVFEVYVHFISAESTIITVPITYQ